MNMMMFRASMVAALAVAVTLLAPPAAAQPFGIDSRAANTTLLIQNLPDDTPGTMQVERVFPRLAFEQPVLMIDAPGDPSRLFVVEKTGRIRVFPKTEDPAPGQVSVFLDLSGRTATGNEQGLLGLAFDPDYTTNGEFYVYYSWNGTSPGTSRVSRFVNDNPAGNPSSTPAEEVVIAIPQPATNHNGGMIAFGPDDMLYVGLGDGGGSNDTFGHGQNTTTLLATILRLDVRGTPDPGLNYAIPPDNPFVNGGPAGGATRKEIFAYGLRNPWRFSFDRLHGHLICGDVGQGTWEEVDIIESGNNYGWSIMEGDHCFQASTCDTVGLTRPIAEYSHAFGNSITGGFVYYGDAVPSLYGMYIYADYGSRRVWGLRYANGQATSPQTLISSASTLTSIAGFGQDASGEVYLLDFNFTGGGGVYVLRPQTAGGEDDFPRRLSDLPALLAAGLEQDQTNAGILPYEPSAKLWSDGTLKSRFIALPGLRQIGYREFGGWNFPENSVIVKNFSMPLDERDPVTTARRVETRILYRKNSAWHGFTFEWNEEQTDAHLLTEGKDVPFSIIDAEGKPLEFTYRIPSRNACLNCHNGASNGVLGLNTPQMNYEFEYPASGVTDNQLRTFEHIELFTNPLPAPPGDLPRMPDPFDSDDSLHERARAYLAANCSHCHRPAGTAPTLIDLRWETAVADMLVWNEFPIQGTLGIPNARIIRSYSPEGSVLWHRMNRRDNFQMPPIATSRVDEPAVELMRQWIEQDGLLGAAGSPVLTVH